MIRNRGKRPSWIACRVIEKAPVITAWLATTVATVAMITIGSSNGSGQRRKKNASVGRRARQHDRCLSGIVQDQRREDEARPDKLDRPPAEVAHIGIEHFRAGCTEKHSGELGQGNAAATGKEEAQPDERI